MFTYSKTFLYSKILFLLPLLLKAQEAGDSRLIQAEIDWLAELGKGGSTAVALVVLLVAGITFTVERILAMRSRYIVPEGLAVEIAPLWGKAKYEEILNCCAKHPSTLSRMIEYLTNHRNADPALLIPGAQDIATRELRSHGHKIYSLAVVAALAPLLGLLGTMIGMIESFKLVEIYGDEGGAAMLAGSISKALITTAVGLIIAIPSLGVYHGLKYRLNYMGDILEEELEALLNAWLLTEKETFAAEAESALS